MPPTRLTRRESLKLATAGLASGMLASTAPALSATKPKIKALAFDAFPIFDPRPVFSLAEQLFPGKGTELSNAWRTRQFEYQWLRVLTGRYADFWQVTEDALLFSAQSLKLDLTAEKRSQLMDAYLRLKAWPDATAALQALQSLNLRLAFLSNLTPKILEAGLKNSSLGGLFEKVFSTDKAKTFKPDPRAYQMAIDGLRLKKEEILFVASSGWDAAGAKSFGYPTFWVNRMNLPAEQLGVTADAVGKNMEELVAFAKI